MNTAPASVTSAAPSSPPTLNRIRKTSAFLTKLSLKAEKNWHQKSGAKRRDVINDVNISGRAGGGGGEGGGAGGGVGGRAAGTPRQLPPRLWRRRGGGRAGGRAGGRRGGGGRAAPTAGST